MTDSADIIYIVHGSNAHTWWRRVANHGYPWWRRWSAFCNELRNAFELDCQIREFQWSGRNTHAARIDAGTDLAHMIEKEKPGRKVHIVGHSHGGNVALSAVNQLKAGTVASVILLANPNMATLDSRGSTEWLYWGHAADRVQLLWNLYSPQDIVQCKLARLFHGIPGVNRKTVAVYRTCEGSAGSIQNGQIQWQGKFSAHWALHSAAMGAVVGSLLRGRTFAGAIRSAGLSMDAANTVTDRGGWPGTSRTQELISRLADPGAFDLTHNGRDVGILFLHGFTASPSEMRNMAQFMARGTGWRCKAILLPGHGTRVEDMQEKNGEEWVQAAEHAYHELAGECRHVFLAGLSLGAVLCCHVAFRRSDDPKLRGLILLAPAFNVTPFRSFALRVLRPLINLRSKGKRAADYFLDNRLYSYLETPLNRATEVLRLGHYAAKNMSKLRHLPVLMFAGERESTVSLNTILSLVRKNPWIKFVKLRQSRHILTMEPDREMMFEASTRFVEQCLGKQL
jgi:carboxylesterase